MKTTLISIIFSSFIFVSGAGFVPRNIKMPFLLRSFIGINLCCLVAIPILYFNAKMINILIPSLIAIGYIFIIKYYFTSSRKFTFKRIFNNKNILNLGAFSFVFVLMILSFLDFFPTEYIYSEHDLLYWSWSTNFHEIDYNGTKTNTKFS